MLASRHCILKTILKKSWSSFVWIWNNSNQRHKRHNFPWRLTLPSEGWHLESSSGRSSAHRNLLEGFQILRRAWTRYMWKICPVRERDSWERRLWRWHSGPLWGLRISCRRLSKPALSPFPWRKALPCLRGLLASWVTRKTATMQTIHVHQANIAVLGLFIDCFMWFFSSSFASS